MMKREARRAAKRRRLWQTPPQAPKAESAKDLSDAEKVANAALGLDLVCSDPHLWLSVIAAIALARRILREVTQQP